MIFQNNCIVFSVDPSAELDWGMIIQAGEIYEKTEIVGMMDKPADRLYLLPLSDVSTQSLSKLFSDLTDSISKSGVKSIPGVIEI